MQWYQLGNLDAAPTLLQQGIVATSGTYRYFPNLSVDAKGSMALAYAYSSNSDFAGISYTGRLAADAPGTLQPEAVLKAGEVTINGSRYGDYAGCARRRRVYDLALRGVRACSGSAWGTWAGSMRQPSCTLASVGGLALLPHVAALPARSGWPDDRGMLVRAAIGVIALLAAALRVRRRFGGRSGPSAPATGDRERRASTSPWRTANQASGAFAQARQADAIPRRALRRGRRRHGRSGCDGMADLASAPPPARRLLDGARGAPAIAALATALPMHEAYHRHALAACLPPATRSGCDLIVRHFRSEFGDTAGLGRSLILVPALLGAFVGAPLVARELEFGTYRLVWTQAVSRRRWLVSKTALLAAATVLGAGLLAILVTWWRHPFAALDGRLGLNVFEIEGVVVPAYAVFALALGVLAGTLLRRGRSPR